MEKRIKIGLFIDTFFPMVDGVINVVDNYARRLITYADVVVFAPTGRKKFDDSSLPYKVIRCTKKLKLSFLDYDLPLPKFDRKFMKAVKNEKLDLIHIHSPFTIGKVGLNYGKENNIPVIATIHSYFKDDFFTATKSESFSDLMLNNVMSCFNNCNEVWAVNKGVADEYFHKFNLKRYPKIQNNGTDLFYYDNEQKINYLKSKYKIKKDEKVLLFVGRIHVLKRIFFILDALKILKEKGFKFKMIFVGTGPDFDKLKEKINLYEMNDCIILAGKIMDREKLTQFYNLSDLFLFPSLYDCSSLVQIEAASQKTPTLFVRGSRTSLTCKENVNAFFSDDNVEEYAKNIINIFSDQDNYNKIKQGAYKDVYVHWDNAVKKVYDDYITVLEKHENHFYDNLKTKEYKEHYKKIKKNVIKQYKNNKKKKKND